MSPPKNFTLEVCVETAGGLEACKGIVDRIELCTGLEVGGLTPSAGLMIAARESGLETHVLIRPRTGDFELSSQDLAVALNDIRAVKDAGLHGVVIGATKGAILDLGVLKELIAAADGLCITLHRAFDTVTDLPSWDSSEYLHPAERPKPAMALRCFQNCTSRPQVGSKSWWDQV